MSTRISKLSYICRHICLKYSYFSNISQHISYALVPDGSWKGIDGAAGILLAAPSLNMVPLWYKLERAAAIVRRSCITEGKARQSIVRTRCITEGKGRQSIAPMGISSTFKVSVICRSQRISGDVTDLKLY